MESTFRTSMNWLHTWAGVVLGGLLFAIFWMGTLSVFDREIDRWMAPMTRLALPSEPLSVEKFRPSLDAAAAANAAAWTLVFPDERQPAFRVTYRTKSGNVLEFRDPSTGATLPDSGTLGGTRFIFPFHYNLHLRVWDLGYWIVGFAGMAMLVLCISGVVIHPKIFTEFFTFRPEKKPRRLILDLHNVTGVLGLPFHIVISLSGLIIFFSLYFPSVWQVGYSDDRVQFNRETWGTYNRPKANEAASVGSLDAMVAEARGLWNGGKPFYLRVLNPGDAAAVALVGRSYQDVVTLRTDIVYFDAPSGALLHRFEPLPLGNVQRLISGLHFIQFQHWTLRWVYFALGLVGCVLIATGYLFWLEIAPSQTHPARLARRVDCRWPDDRQRHRHHRRHAFLLCRQPAASRRCDSPGRRPCFARNVGLLSRVARYLRPCLAAFASCLDRAMLDDCRARRCSRRAERDHHG